MGSLTSILAQELADLDGIQSQHPEKGSGINSGTVYIDQYTNRIFGAPFQLIDSVDRRFEDVNIHVGNEYLRNFILNSPILHIKPGMPKYTGGTDSESLANSIRDIYVGTQQGMGFVESLLTELASGTVFSKGSKLQKRMFGFRETYHSYMSHVNYMCRSMATFLNLTTNVNGYSTYTYANGNNGYATLQKFETMKWENYRMLAGRATPSPIDNLNAIGSSTLIGASIKTAANAIKDKLNGIGNSPSSAATAVAGTFSGKGGAEDILGVMQGSNTSESSPNNFQSAMDTSVIDVLSDKICSVLFMVEPVQFEESLTNSAEPSVIESTIDAINSSIGQEIAFITGSNVDLGLVEGMTDFLGDTVSTAANFINGLVEPIAGGFTSNLFHGALQSVKGQKMIYPKIYKSSNSEMNYTFTVNLSTPYGDVYNYYMNIIVPLMHLIALASPRMVTANSITSPFLVQAFIPGMCTCQLGIISSMQIVKNPSAKHVSVNGFPLDVKVTFTIQELYNSMSISPANDPASFLFNETLNDYMANLGGLQPSVDTYTRQRIAMFKGLQQYFEQGEYLQDVANDALMGIENMANPYVANGS